MKKRFFIILLFFAIAFNFGCNNNLENVGFTLSKESNSSNVFRLDGYYYLDRKPILQTYVFYGSGQVLDCIVNWHTLSDFENYLEKGDVDEIVKGYRRSWGRYLVNNSNVQIEFPNDYSPSTNLSTGVVLNDTTLLLLTKENTLHKGLFYLDDTLHFIAFGLKPDSTFTRNN